MKSKSKRSRANLATKVSSLTSLPSGTKVRLIFHGLSAFWRNGKDCIVGFHNRGDNHHKHPLQITGYEKSGSTCTKKYSTSTDLVGKMVELQIAGADLSKADRALFYQPQGVRLDRDKISDPQDFQWVLDFEAAYLYGSPLQKDLTAYDPQIAINPAIFYTLKKTNGKFVGKTSDGSPVPGNGLILSDLVNVAEYVAANVYLFSGGSVTLVVDGVKAPAISKGEIHFFNECRDGNTACDFEPANPSKDKRNDFYLHYKALNLGYLPEIELVLSKAGINAPPTGLCGPKKYIEANDNAPCAGSGYGGGGGFPPYPPEKKAVRRAKPVKRQAKTSKRVSKGR
jgi:hypothetical protein